MQEKKVTERAAQARSVRGVDNTKRVDGDGTFVAAELATRFERVARRERSQLRHRSGNDDTQERIIVKLSLDKPTRESYTFYI